MELLSAGELQQYGISKEELLERFTQQLHRDFEMAGLSVFLPMNDMAFVHNLSSSLMPVLEKMDRAGKIQSLLYRIDITEQQYRSALQQQPENSYSALAELVIKRVLQKVIFKLVYSC